RRRRPSRAPASFPAAARPARYPPTPRRAQASPGFCFGFWVVLGFTGAGLAAACDGLGVACALGGAALAEGFASSGLAGGLATGRMPAAAPGRRPVAFAAPGRSAACNVLGPGM